MNETVDYSQLPLRDIHLPEAAAWWAPAPGWWLLAAAALILAAALWLRHRRAGARRAALAAAERVARQLRDGEEPVHCLQELSVVLRRFALSVRSGSGSARREVAGLTGERWLAYLDSRWQRTAFTTPLGCALLAAPYRPPGSVSTEQALQLSALCAAWMRAQRPER